MIGWEETFQLFYKSRAATNSYFPCWFDLQIFLINLSENWKMPITISLTPMWHHSVFCFCLTNNPKTQSLNLLNVRLKKSSKSSHLRSWNRLMFDIFYFKWLIHYQNSYRLNFLNSLPGYKLIWMNMNSQAALILIDVFDFCFVDNWSAKAKRRNTTGTGRLRHLKVVYRRFR